MGPTLQHILNTPAVQNVEARMASADFLRLCRALLAYRGNPMQVAGKVAGNERLSTIVRSAITGGNMVDWSELAGFGVLSTAFSASLRSISVFDAALADGIVPAPLRSRAVIISSGIGGSIVGERAIKPVSSMSLGSTLLVPNKAVAIVIVSKELAMMSDPSAGALFDSELRFAVALATDTKFLSTLVAITTPTASAGTTLAAIMTDLSVLLSAVQTGADSKLYYVASPANMKKLALLTSTSGGLAFPGLGANGGQAMGITFIASNAIASDVALLFDARAIAGSADTIRLDATEQAIVQLESSPDSPPVASTVMQSLWQTDNRALRAERFFGFSVFRTNGIASLNSVNY